MMRFTRLAATSLALFVLVQAIGVDTVMAAIPDAEDCDDLALVDPSLIPDDPDDLDADCYSVTHRRHSRDIQYDVGGVGNLENVTPSSIEWPTTWADGVAMPGGIHVASTIEGQYRLTPANGSSANISLTAQPKWVDFNGMRTLTTGAIHVLQYQFLLKPELIMNGVSEFWWRSPVAWEEDNFTAHYVNIIDLNEDGTTRYLYAAARYMTNPPTTDTNDARLHNGRLYYHFSGLLPSDRTFTVNEYIVPKTIGGATLALPDLGVYASEGQDIAGDNLKVTRLFPGHGSAETYYNANLVEGQQFLEMGWSARFYVGMGAGGTVGLLEGNDTMPVHHVRARFIKAERYDSNADGVGDANKVRVVLPLKMSSPVTMTVSVTPFRTFADRVANQTGAGSQAGTTVSYTTPQPIAGTFIHEFPLADVNWAGDQATHWYDVTFAITLYERQCGSADNLEPGVHLRQCSFLNYPMSDDLLPDGTKAWHIVDKQGSNLQTSHAVYAQPWVEVYELHDPSLQHTDSTPAAWGTIVLGAALIIGGILAMALVVVAAPVAVPLILVGAAGTAFVGLLLVSAGAQGVSINDALFRKEGWDAALKGVGTLLAATACTAMFLPGVGGTVGRALGVTTKALRGVAGTAALGAACAAGLLLAGNGIDGLLKLVIDIPQIIIKGLELGGKLLARLIDFALIFLDNAEGWVKAAYIAFSALTVLWAIREFLLWLMNMLWPIVSSMGPPARQHAQRFEDILENISIPLWDTLMYKYGSVRGRYRRHRKGGNPE